ncbi:MAG: hypothetical protein ACKVWR_16930 [Acidimicrobiales bacterium]
MTDRVDHGSASDDYSSDWARPANGRPPSRPDGPPPAPKPLGGDAASYREHTELLPAERAVLTLFGFVTLLVGLYVVARVGSMPVRSIFGGSLALIGLFIMAVGVDVLAPPGPTTSQDRESLLVNEKLIIGFVGLFGLAAGLAVIFADRPGVTKAAVGASLVPFSVGCLLLALRVTPINTDRDSYRREMQEAAGISERRRRERYR